MYAGVGLFVSTLVIGGTAGMPAASAAPADPAIQVVGLTMPKTLAQVHDGVAYLDEDSSGNLYFGGGANLAGWVWTATPAGVVSRFAGSGVTGFAGDGGPALEAQIPAFNLALKVAPNDEVYINGGGRIRRIDASGTITTVAGNGTFGTSDGDGGPATSAVLGSVVDFDIDSVGNIYLAAREGLRKVTASTGIISTLVSSDIDDRECASLNGPVGSADISNTAGITVAANDDVFLAVGCTSGRRIIEIDTPLNTSSVFAGGGAGSEDDGGPATGIALTNTINKLESGPNGSVEYRTQSFDPEATPSTQNVIRSISATGVMSTPLIDFGAVQDFIVRSGAAYVLGTNFDNMGGIISASGSTRTFLTAGADPADGVDPTTRQVSGLIGLAVDADGVIYYSTSTASIVRSVSTGDVLDTVIGTGTTVFGVTYGGAATATDWVRGSSLHSADNGELYALANSQSVGRVNGAGNLIDAYTPGPADPSPRAITTIGSTLYVGGVQFQSFPDPAVYSVSEIDGSGNIVQSNPVPIPIQSFPGINDLATTPDAQILVAPSTGPGLISLDPVTGDTTTVPVPDGVNGKTAVEVDAAGTIFLVDFRGLMMIPTTGSPTVVDTTPFSEIDIDDGGNVYANRYGTITKFTGLGAAVGGGDVVIGGVVTGTTASGVMVTISVDNNDSTTTGPLGPVNVVSQPANGTATATSATTIVYTSDPGFGGTDTFTYERCSTTAPLVCGVGTVTVTVTGGSNGGGASLVTVVPARLYETRALPNTTTDGQQQAQGRRASDTVTEIQVAGRGGVPANASAAILNITAIRPDSGGFLTAFPCGADQPGSSTLNAAPGDVVANNIVVKIGDGGKVCVYNLAETHLVVDVTGFAPATSSFGTVVPARVYDTRPLPNMTTDNQQQAQGRRAAGQLAEVLVAGRGGVPANADAVALNTTVARPDGNGFATVFPCGEDRPLASTLNYAAGDVVPNGAVVKIGEGGKVCIYTSRGTDLVVDVTGFAPASTDIVSVVPARLFETRALPNQTVDGQQQEQGRRTAGQLTEVQITGRNGIPTGASTAVLNVTAVRPTDGGFVTVFPCGEDQPGSSTLNYRDGEVVANGTIVKIGDGGKVCVFSLRAMHLVVDVTGYLP